MPDGDGSKRNLEGPVRQPSEEFLRRSSLTYLECCISLMLSHLPADEVAMILEAEARMIRDFD